MTKGQKILATLLVLFFTFAAFMTWYSQKRYMESLSYVEVGSGECKTIQLQRTLEVERESNNYEPITVTWDIGRYNSQLFINKEILVCTDEQVLTGVITKVLKDEKDVPTVTIDVDWKQTPGEDCWNVVLVTSIRSIEYEHVFPIDCLMGNNQIAMVYSRPKRWGTECYIHFADVIVSESNGVECAIKEIPYGGEVVCGSEGRLYEGQCVLVRNVE